jgi:hypothetical protein
MCNFCANKIKIFNGYISQNAIYLNPANLTSQLDPFSNKQTHLEADVKALSNIIVQYNLFYTLWCDLIKTHIILTN